MIDGNICLSVLDKGLSKVRLYFRMAGEAFKPGLHRQMYAWSAIRTRTYNVNSREVLFTEGYV